MKSYVWYLSPGRADCPVVVRADCILTTAPTTDLGLNGTVHQQQLTPRQGHGWSEAGLPVNGNIPKRYVTSEILVLITSNSVKLVRAPSLTFPCLGLE